MANIRPNGQRTSIGPTVKYPSQPISPEIPRDLGAEYFSAMKNAFAGLGELGATLQAKKKASDSFEGELGYIRLATEDSLKFVENLRNMEPGDPNFAEGQYAAFKERHETWINNLEKSGTDPEVIKDLRIKLANLDNSIVTKAITAEEGSRVVKHGIEFSEAGRALAVRTQHDPGSLDDNLAALEKAYKKTQGIMDPDEALKIYDQEKARITYAAAVGDAFQRAPDVMARLEPGGGGEGEGTLSAQGLIKQFEGYISTPKYDVNALRGGYGSDTVTLADGTVKRVTAGMKITRADADRDLARRAKEFEADSRHRVGPEAWDDLGDNVRAALVSITYNYGKLPANVVRAARTGDPETIAKAVEGLKGHNNGVNARRRQLEANIIRGDTSGYTGKAGGGGRSLDYLDNLTPEQQRQIYNLADNQITKNAANGRAELDLQVDNMVAAAANGEQYAGGSPLTLDRYNLAYDDPTVAERKFQQDQGRIKVAQETFNFGSKSPEAITEAITKYENSFDVGSDEFSADKEATLAAMRTAQANVAAAWKANPVAEAQKYFPRVKAAFESMYENPKDDTFAKRYYRQLEQAYRFKGLAKGDWKVFAPEQLSQMKTQWAEQGAQATVYQLLNLADTLTPDMFDAAMQDLEDGAPSRYAVIAEWGSLYKNVPGFVVNLINAEEGWRKAFDPKTGDKAFAPDETVMEESVATLFGGNLAGMSKLPPGMSKGIRQLATGLYIYNEGPPVKDAFDTELFNQGFRKILGGDGSEDTGVVNGTILPPGTTGRQFFGMKETITPGQLQSLYVNDRDLGTGILPAGMPQALGGAVDISAIRDASIQFVKTGNDEYLLYSAVDRKPLFDEFGEPYFVRVTSEDIQRFGAVEAAAKQTLADDVVDTVAKVIGTKPILDSVKNLPPEVEEAFKGAVNDPTASTIIKFLLDEKGGNMTMSRLVFELMKQVPSLDLSDPVEAYRQALRNISRKYIEFRDAPVEGETAP